MSKFDYTKAQETALRLVDKFGVFQELAFVRVSSNYDPVVGKRSNISMVTTGATLVTVPATSGTTQGFDNRLMEQLRRGKVRFFYVAHVGLLFEPRETDYLIFEGQVWQVMGSTPTNPAGLPVLHSVGVQQTPISELADVLLSEGAEIAGESLTLNELIALIAQLKDKIYNEDLRDLEILP